MHKVTFVVAVFLASAVAQAQTVTCSVSGLNAKQTTLLAAFLADINAHPPSGAPVPFADFNTYCGWKARNDVIVFIAAQQAVTAAQVGAQATAHGDETAPNAQCAAASLANGCTKSQVACFVLTGNTACN